MSDKTDEKRTYSEESQAAVVSRRALQKGKKTVEKNYSHLEKLQVVYVPLDGIKPNAYNPNRQSEHDFEMLVRSMEEDGFTQPVLVNDGANAPQFKDTICDGEHRWRAAQVLGFKEIPVVYVSFTEAQMKISTIRHNKARGSHDIQLEAEMLRDLQALGALGHAQDSLMLDDVEINRLLEDISAPDAMADLEYSDAWVPDCVSAEDRQLIEQGAQPQTSVTEQDGLVTVRGATAATVEVQRKREAAIANAKTEQEKIQIRKDNQIYRIALSFAGEDAEIVKAVLGSAPAEKLLELCRYAAEVVSTE